MIDITRNIVVTAENVERILFNLHIRLIGDVALSNMGSSLGEELYDNPDWDFMLRSISAAKKTVAIVKNLIDRIELVKGDLYKESDGRFHTMPEDVLRCMDCVYFGHTTAWNDKNGYWVVSDPFSGTVFIPVEVSLHI